MTTETTLEPVKVGDIFECNWGYDQTNIDFYEILSVSPSGRTVKVRQICTRTVDSWRDSANKIEPVAGSEHPHNPQILTKRLRATTFGDPRWAFKVASYATAYSWDGTPSWETNSVAGH